MNARRDDPWQEARPDTMTWTYVDRTPAIIAGEFVVVTVIAVVVAVVGWEHQAVRYVALPVAVLLAIAALVMMTAINVKVTLTPGAFAKHQRILGSWSYPAGEIAALYRLTMSKTFLVVVPHHGPARARIADSFVVNLDVPRRARLVRAEPGCLEAVSAWIGRPILEVARTRR